MMLSTFRISKQITMLTVALFFSSAAFGQTITLSPTGGPPTTSTQVSGSGFSPSASIDIFFDTTDEALAIADGSGSFSNIAIPVLASALPGKHTISATPRGGGTGAQATFTVYTNWSQFGFTSRRTAFNPYENVLNPSNVGSLAVKWSFTLASLSSPMVANGVVYVFSNTSSSGRLRALDASTGAMRWSFPAYSYGSPAVANGVVYIADAGYIYALEASTGAKLWSYAIEVGQTDFGTPVVANGVIYVSIGGTPSNVSALDASTGALLWSSPSDGEAVAVANGVVYVTGGNVSAPYVSALNASTGAKLWTSNTVAEAYAIGAGVADGVVYVGYSNGLLYALNASTGALLWSYTTGGSVGSPAVANGVAYVTSYDHNLYALKASTGAKLWSYPVGVTNTLPAVANGVVYVTSRDHNVWALNAGTGAKLWSYTTGKALFTSPAVANGKVYATSEDNKIYAFGLPTATGADEEASAPPDLTTLQPNYSLLPAPPSAMPANNDDN
jgi:outer membrane protein assembly factor BamB